MDNTSEDGEDEYWDTGEQKGFDFNLESDRKSFESIRNSTFSKPEWKQEDRSQFDLIKYDGLSEIAESELINSLTDLAGKFVTTENEEEVLKRIIRKHNPLELSFKKTVAKRTSAIQTAQNIVLGLEYNLKQFKGRADKVDLLKAAVESHDGNTILVVTIFLKNTLKKSIFQREIGKFPEAVNAYLSYLHEDNELDELTNMLLLLDKMEDAAMLRYAATFSLQFERKLFFIQNCLNTHFQPGVVHSLLTDSLLEHRMYLEDEKILEDHKVSLDDSEISGDYFELLTGKKLLMDTSAMCCLIFSFLYFHTVSKLAPISPSSISAHYKFSQKQYTWAALRSLAAMKKWNELNNLFLGKNWLRFSKMKSCIGFVFVLEVLFKMQAPTEVMEKYVSCLDDQAMKLSCAKKYKCHSVVMEILTKNKDRLGLIEYKESLLTQ